MPYIDKNMTKIIPGKVCDNAGFVIEKGDIVAFNYSGNVAIGVVENVKITRTEKRSYGTMQYELVTIRRNKEFGEGISKVKNSQSIVIIEDGLGERYYE